MAAHRTWGIGAGLIVGFAAVLAGPAWLTWSTLRLQGWNQQTLKIRFQSVRYEAAGLVFGYLVENRTFRTARILPEHTQLRALQQAGRPPVGFAHMPLPLVLPGHSRQLVEIRLEPSFAPRAWFHGIEEEQTRLLQTRPPDSAHDESFVSPLPAPAAPKKPAAPAEEPPIPVWSPQESLADLDGFELINEGQSAHIRFPRGW